MNDATPRKTKSAITTRRTTNISNLSVFFKSSICGFISSICVIVNGMISLYHNKRVPTDWVIRYSRRNLSLACLRQLKRNAHRLRLFYLLFTTLCVGSSIFLLFALSKPGHPHQKYTGLDSWICSL